MPTWCLKFKIDTDVKATNVTLLEISVEKGFTLLEIYVECIGIHFVRDIC